MANRTDMTVQEYDELKKKYKTYIIPDLGTIHYAPLRQAVTDINKLVYIIDELDKRLVDLLAQVTRIEDALTVVTGQR